MNSTNVKLEYIWLDGNTPEPNLRSKTKIWAFNPTKNAIYQPQRGLGYDGRVIPCIDELPLWGFDGSSTKQATGDKSDCVLKAVKVVMDPQRNNAFLVMCEVLNADETPHKTNHRNSIPLNDDWWFGFEQEYVLEQGNGLPVGWPSHGHFPKPQGDYYCGVGHSNVNGRDIAEEHLEVCLQAGFNMTGINAEVMLGQWEYQLFQHGGRSVADELWLSRYLLYRIAEKYQIRVNLSPKPVKGDWNGSGMHCNFSNGMMREKGGSDMIMDMCEKLKTKHKQHIKDYGADNEQRLTGLHETQSIKKFSYGVSDRGASIRIPLETHRKGYGYLEDRRPASNADPYKVTYHIMNTLQEFSN